MTLPKNHNFNVHLFHKSSEVVDYISNGHKTDLILMDMDMGNGVSGADIAEVILTIKELPIIFFTFHEERSHTERAGKVFNYGYVHKDCSEFLLLETINNALKLFEQKKRIEESEKKFHSLFEAEADAVYLVEEETLDILEANRAAEQLYGYTKEEFTQLKVSDISAEPSKTDKEIRERAISNVPLRLHKRKDGSIFSVEINSRRYTLDDRRVTVSTVRNVTERIEAEEKLRKSEEQYKFLIDSIQTAVVVHDADTRIIRANPKALELLGGEEDIEGRTVFDPGWKFFNEDGEKIPPEEMPAVDVISSQKPIINRTVGIQQPLSSNMIWVTVSAVPIFEDDAIQQVIVSFVDITETVQKKEALRQNEAELRYLFETMIEGFIWTDTQGTIVMANKAAAEMFAYDIPADLIGLHISKLNAEPEIFEEKLSTIYKEESIQNLEFQGKKRDGSHGWMLVNLRVLKTKEGENIGTEILLRDITERKHQFEELKLLRQAIEETPVSIIMTDTDGRIEYVNPFFCSITGYSADEVLGENPRILKSGTHDDKFYKNMWETLSKGENWTGEICNKNKDGKLFWEYSTISPVRDNEGTTVYYIAIKEDIRERKELENLKEDVDRITRHDMRSSLNGIIGVPQVLMENENITDTQRQYLQMIIESGQNILNMINLSLTIYKIEQGTYELTESKFDVLNIFRQCKANYDLHLNSGNIEFITYTDGFDSANPNHIMVKGEELLSYSVISNLVKNAIEASPSGGTVEVRLRNTSRIIITINNQGTVPQNMQDTFFDKYTTSGKKGGTGLGTYSAKILAEAQGWEISMETSEEEGTTIALNIPK